MKIVPTYKLIIETLIRSGIPASILKTIKTVSPEGEIVEGLSVGAVGILEMFGAIKVETILRNFANIKVTPFPNSQEIKIEITNAVEST